VPSDPKFPASEAPTAPERGARCPRCDGDGSLLVDISEDDRPRMARRLCGVCQGRKWISREELARYVLGASKG
jgi:excinuclease UvrABC ATPase subunit